MAMEDESLAGVEAAPQVLSLTNLQQWNPLLHWQALLSPRLTSSALIVVVRQCSTLWILMVEDFAALGFISARICTDSNVFDKSSNSLLDSTSGISENHGIKSQTIFFKFQNLHISTVHFLALGVFIVMFSQDSATDLPAVFPVGLASLFVI